MGPILLDAGCLVSAGTATVDGEECVVPMSYSIDQESRMVRCRAWGTLTNEDLRDHYQQLAADPEFTPAYSQIGDLTGVVALTADSATIAEVASRRVFNAEVRRAIIAPSDSAYGVSRMFAIYAERAGQDVQVFRDADAAERWVANHVAKAGH